MPTNPNWPKEIENILAGLMNAMERDIRHYEIPPKELLKKIADETAKIDTAVDPKPPVPSEVYVREFEEYTRGSRSQLDSYVIRKLCWAIGVATDNRFIQYVQRNNIPMNARAIRGFVFSAHMKWFHRESIRDELNAIKRFVSSYDGVNKGINKWKRAIDLVLGLKAHEQISSELISRKLEVNEFFKEWGLYPGTELYNLSVMNGISKVAEKLNEDQVFIPDSGPPGRTKREILGYALTELFSLVGLPKEIFKRGIAEIILSRSLQTDATLADMVKDFILRTPSLGDPRLPQNGPLWAGIDEGAKSKVIEWFSRADIIFFFEHVLRPGDDTHGRKKFWLRYVKSFRKTRCLLCRDDFNRLIGQAKKSQIEGCGRASSADKSAFLLDFGPLLIVEFSKVGACYIYSTGNIPRTIRDFWSQNHFKDSDLKNKQVCQERIVHRPDWKQNIAGILARHGIRPDPR